MKSFKSKDVKIDGENEFLFTDSDQIYSEAGYYQYLSD